MSRFSATNRLATCRCCGKRTHSSIESIDIDLCRVCYDAAGQENEHSDNGHPVLRADCPTCQGVSCLHELGVRPVAPAPVTIPIGARLIAHNGNGRVFCDGKKHFLMHRVHEQGISVDGDCACEVVS